MANEKTGQGLAQPLLKKMQQHLVKGNQVLLFINRRGYAPVLFCPQCRWAAKCHRCDAKLTLHRQLSCLQCHYCYSQQPILNQCHHCNHQPLVAVGSGTEKFAEYLQNYFPQYEIIRIDRDSTQGKHSFNQIFQQIQQGKADILLGTQMLAKGHHFPKVTLVGILDADYGFFSNDFRATEQLGQLLLQVAGRAGREDQLGEVVIQTHLPEHPLLQQILAHGYLPFAETLLGERQIAKLPPYSYLALYKAETKQRLQAIHTLENIKKIAASFNQPAVELLGPIPAPMEKRADYYRAHLLLKATQRPVLQSMLTRIGQHLPQLKIPSSVRLLLDVDPIDLY